MTQVDGRTGLTKHYKMKNCEKNVDFKNYPQAFTTGAYCAENPLFLSGVDKKDQISFQLAFYSCYAYKKLVVINEYEKKESNQCVTL